MLKFIAMATSKIIKDNLFLPFEANNLKTAQGKFLFLIYFGLAVKKKTIFKFLEKHLWVGF